MNKQKIFNRVAKHLIKQGRKAINPEADKFFNTRCAYRVYVGDRNQGNRRVLKCAIGCLIPFQAYDPRIEGQGIHSHAVSELLEELGIIKAEEYNRHHYDFLSDLQSAHDEAPEDKFLPVVITSLRGVARNYGLDPSVLG